MKYLILTLLLMGCSSKKEPKETPLLMCEGESNHHELTYFRVIEGGVYYFELKNPYKRYTKGYVSSTRCNILYFQLEEK